MTDIHSFHIPVMGTSFTIDSPLRVGKFGISSVLSIGDHELAEIMRRHYAEQYQLPYEPIEKTEFDAIAKRIKAYLNLVQDILDIQMKALRRSGFAEGTDLTKYFELLPESHPLAQKYQKMLVCKDNVEKTALQQDLLTEVRPGSIDVNILTKVDRANYGENGELLPNEYSDALSAFRGFAQSKLESSIVLSAGFNRRLYAYCEEFPDFFPDKSGNVKKKIILKVSDFRSSQIQGKFFAKKGVWVWEYRIESGLNCGGHAFATDGLLMGPILEEFKSDKDALFQDLLGLCNEALQKKGQEVYAKMPKTRVTVQGGIGQNREHDFLLQNYKVDGTGWATPFLLVPEATLVDDETRALLAGAKEKDLYLSGISPLGVPFNTVRGTMSEKQRLERIEKNRPGSPCPKGHLVSNVEFSKKPVCTASVFYQKRKLAQLEALTLPKEQKERQKAAVLAKTCLCEDLAAGALISNNISSKWTLKSAVCPGPNLAYFSKISTLKEMVGHIYGKVNLLRSGHRPHFFISELKMYVEYFEEEIKKVFPEPTQKQRQYLILFKENLLKGIDYYKSLFPTIKQEAQKCRDTMLLELGKLSADLDKLIQTYKLAEAS